MNDTPEVDTHQASEPSPTPAAQEPPRLGFRAFAEVYRARWAANHPDMKPRETPVKQDPGVTTSTLAADAEAEVPSKEGTTLASQAMRNLR